MYTFTDDGDRSLTLRPEGTAGAVRAYIEHGMHNQAAAADCQPVEYELEHCPRVIIQPAHNFRVNLESGKVQLKEMETGEAEEVSVADLVEILKEKCGK